jgi:Flp pilus assembly CpaE family ATPase
VRWAAELRRSGAGRVGLLDFDLAGGMAGLWFGVDGGYSILDAVHNLGSMDASLWKGLVSAVQPELDVLGAPAGIPLGA